MIEPTAEQGGKMQHRVLVLVCDFCKHEGEGVETREIVDHQGRRRIVEACARCWERQTRGIMKRARSPRRRRRKAGGTRLQAVS